jgi:crossover junction endodeoxyribonuclease RuvC
MTMIIGIDPGLSGAIAIIEDGRLIYIDDMPTVMAKKKSRVDVRSLRGLLLDVDGFDTTPPVYLEQVSSMPMQGVSSAFNFGRTYGEIRGVLIALGFTVHDVTPQTWKFNVGLRAVAGATTKDRKNASRACAIELFPNCAHLFARAKDDGRAEAALIAYYGAMHQSSL